MSETPSTLPLPPRRFWLGYAAGVAVVLVGVGLRLANTAVAIVLYSRFRVLQRYGYEPIFEAVADIGLAVVYFGFAVLLLTLHHHFQAGRAGHAGRGFETLPPGPSRG
jgi:hypothetical protein